MNYKVCELVEQEYNILSQYGQSAHLIETATCFRAFPMCIHFVQLYCWILIGSWNVATAREWDFAE